MKKLFPIIGFLVAVSLVTLTAFAEEYGFGGGFGEMLSKYTITGSGTSGNVPVFTDVDEIGNSIIEQYNSKIGINESSASQLLHITDGFLKIERDTAGAGLYFQRTGMESWQMVQTTTGDDGLGFWNVTDSAYRLFLTQGGNVGIGTSTPSYKLDVDGVILARDGLLSYDAIGTTGGLNVASGDLEVEFGYIDVMRNPVYATDFLPTCPYPENLDIAYNSVISMRRLSDGVYDPDDVEMQLDNSSLDEFVSRESPSGRQAYSLAAITGAQNEVIKDLVQRVSDLEERVADLETFFGARR